MDIKSVQQNLGITKEQAIALDKLDGKEDGQISQDIFTQARDAITKRKGNANCYEEASIQDGTPTYHQIIDILKNVGHKKEVAKTAKIKQSKNVNTMQMPTEVSVMQQMAEEALKYYVKNGGNLEGFKFEGFPKGISNLSISTQTGYDDDSNDVFSIENGSQVVDRNADAFTLTINYVLNGQKYSAKVETKDLSGISAEARREFISGMEQIFMNKEDSSKPKPVKQDRTEPIGIQEIKNTHGASFYKVESQDKIYSSKDEAQAAADIEAKFNAKEETDE